MEKHKIYAILVISLNIDCPDILGVKVAIEGLDEHLSWGQEGVKGSGSEGHCRV